MGHAAYKRGTQVIRDQIDRDVQQFIPASNARHERELQREEIASLKHQLQEAHAQQERERETYAAALASLAEASAEIETLDAKLFSVGHNLMTCREDRDLYRSKWQKLSAIVRHGMTPEQFRVAELTATMHDHNR